MMATPKTNKTAKQDETTTPKDGTLGNNTNPEEGESTEPNMTSPERHLRKRLPPEQDQEKTRKR